MDILYIESQSCSVPYIVKPYVQCIARLCILYTLIYSNKGDC